MTAISRSHHDGQFGQNPTISQKIEIFSERVLGWQIDVAEEMSRQFFEVLAQNAATKPMRHCAFAIVSVIISYFETIAQYLQGASSHQQSADFFGYGFRDVYPTSGLNESQIKKIYVDIRCGMYHSGLTRPGVHISGEHYPTFQCEKNGQVLLNPFTLVQDIKQHFLAYVVRLRDGSDLALRQRFETVFDYGVSRSEFDRFMGSGGGW